ncbi:hypothetical protein GCM10020001_066820 [Nonomuraea salmonea]
MTETKLAPGDAAPEFALPTADGGTVSLDAYRGKRVILYFYPAAMTPPAAPSRRAISATTSGS